MNDRPNRKSARNAEILRRHEAGETVRQLAEVYNLHPSRIGQLIQLERKRVLELHTKTLDKIEFKC